MQTKWAQRFTDAIQLDSFCTKPPKSNSPERQPIAELVLQPLLANFQAAGFLSPTSFFLAADQIFRRRIQLLQSRSNCCNHLLFESGPVNFFCKVFKDPIVEPSDETRSRHCNKNMIQSMADRKRLLRFFNKSVELVLRRTSRGLLAVASVSRTSKSSP